MQRQPKQSRHKCLARPSLVERKNLKKVEKVLKKLKVRSLVSRFVVVEEEIIIFEENPLLQ